MVGAHFRRENCLCFADGDGCTGRDISEGLAANLKPTRTGPTNAFAGKSRIRTSEVASTPRSKIQSLRMRPRIDSVRALVSYVYTNCDKKAVARDAVSNVKLTAWRGACSSA